MKHALVYFVAAIYCLAAVPAYCFGQGGTGQVGSPYHRLADNHQQSVDAGWVPNARQWEDGSRIGDATPAESCPVKLDEENERQQSLRRAYNGRTDRRPIVTDPYRAYGSPSSFQTTSPFIGQDEGEEELDFTPEHIKKQGNEKKNYLVMISADWCVWCKKMYPTLLKLREDGYIIYIFETNREEFQDYAALYNVKAYPTFIVYDGGKEVDRKVGKTDEEWFKKRLKTRGEQKEVPEPPVDDPYKNF